MNNVYDEFWTAYSATQCHLSLGIPSLLCQDSKAKLYFVKSARSSIKMTGPRSKHITMTASPWIKNSCAAQTGQELDISFSKLQLLVFSVPYIQTLSLLQWEEYFEKCCRHLTSIHHKKAAADVIQFVYCLFNRPMDLHDWQIITFGLYSHSPLPYNSHLWVMCMCVCVFKFACLRMCMCV